jgi:hypothetical protein
MSDRNDDEPPEGEGFADRWALVALSVVMSMFGSIVAILMLGSLAAGVVWLSPLLALVVITSSVMAISVSAAAIVLGKRGRWAAFVFAVVPCITVISAWAWEIRHGR